MVKAQISLVAVVAVVGLLAVAAPASAQTVSRDDASAPTAVVDAQRASRRSTSAKAKIAVRPFFAVDFDALAAKQSFNAVLGTSHLTAFGAGADVLNVWRHAFVRFDLTRMSKLGSRAFDFNGQVFSLNEPTRITMRPIEFGGGWQFRTMGPATHLMTPYAGITFVHLGYTDISSGTGADASSDVMTSFNGVGIFGGAEVIVWKPVIVMAEGQYRSLPNAIGTGGLSQDFDETNLGGFTFRLAFGVKF